MIIKLLIFDLDGTLVDTSLDITNALNHAIRPYGLKELTVEDTIKLIGEGITRLVVKVTGTDNNQIHKEIKQRFLSYYAQHLTDYSYEYPHVRETLEKLGNYKKAVISNKRENLSAKLLEKLNLMKYFELVLGSDTTPEKKPSPVPILYVCDKFHISPQETLIIGDSNYDIEAAKRQG